MSGSYFDFGSNSDRAANIVDGVYRPDEHAVDPTDVGGTPIATTSDPVRSPTVERPTETATPTERRGISL